MSFHTSSNTPSDTSCDPATVARAILDLNRPGLCLDFDGTLVEIAPRPEAIAVDPSLPALLHGLSRRFDGRLAIVTGRTHADLCAHIGVMAHAVASSHGAAFSEPGSGHSHALLDPRELDPMRRPLERIVTDHPGTYAEDKGTAIAIHTRPAPHVHGAVLDAVRALAEDLFPLQARAPARVRVSSGKGIVEAKLAGATKGTAIERFMRQPAWHGAQPVMIGDDTTDDDGMAVARRFGGFGVQVGDGPNGVPLAHASLCLTTVNSVHAMLRMLIDGS